MISFVCGVSQPTTPRDSAQHIADGAIPLKKKLNKKARARLEAAAQAGSSGSSGPAQGGTPRRGHTSRAVAGRGGGAVEEAAETAPEPAPS